MVSHETCNFNCKKQVATSSLQLPNRTVSNGFQHKISFPLKSYKNRLFARKKTRYNFNGFPPKAHLPLKGSKKQAKNLVPPQFPKRLLSKTGTNSEDCGGKSYFSQKPPQSPPTHLHLPYKNTSGLPRNAGAPGVEFKCSKNLLIKQLIYHGFSHRSRSQLPLTPGTVPSLVYCQMLKS